MFFWHPPITIENHQALNQEVPNTSPRSGSYPMDGSIPFVAAIPTLVGSKRSNFLHVESNTWILFYISKCWFLHIFGAWNLYFRPVPIPCRHFFWRRTAAFQLEAGPCWAARMPPTRCRGAWERRSGTWRQGWFLSWNEWRSFPMGDWWWILMDGWFLEDETSALGMGEWATCDLLNVNWWRFSSMRWFSFELDKEFTWDLLVWSVPQSGKHFWLGQTWWSIATEQEGRLMKLDHD